MYQMMLYFNIDDRNTRVNKLLLFYTGSILVTATIGGSSSDVNSVLSGVCSTISSGSTMNYNGQSVSLSSSYLMVNGQNYYTQGCSNSTSVSI